MRARILITSVLLISSLSCAGRINKMMASWQGHHYSKLIAKWGPPQQESSDGKGGKVLVYVERTEFTTPGTATSDTSIYGKSATTTTVYVPPKTHGWNSYRMFFVDAEGIIYRWSWKGL